MNLSRLRFIALSTLILLSLDLPISLVANAQDPSTTSGQSAPTVSATVPAKPKKVWTNDDVATSDPPTATKAKASSSVKVSDSSDKRAYDLRAKIEKLEAQLKETDKQLTDLKNFQAGEGNGNGARDLHKGYNMTPIPEQIQKLEQKKEQLQQQIDAAYDEARKRNIQPGQLR
jgi:uncharacterized protein (UPF0335 family)